MGEFSRGNPRTGMFVLVQLAWQAQGELPSPTPMFFGRLGYSGADPDRPN